VLEEPIRQHLDEIESRYGEKSISWKFGRTDRQDEPLKKRSWEFPA
jgi:hypothetical protein